MGWLWSSPSAPKGTNEDSATPASAPPPPPKPESVYSDPEIAKFMAQIQAEFGSPDPTPQSQPPPPPASSKPTPSTTSQAESTESQWRSLWGPAAQSETEPSSSSSITSAYTNQRRTEPAATSPPRPRQHPDQLDPISESLLPTTMSCRAALDAAFYCQSPGGQWNAVYREGGVRSCSDHWDDLFFCMRTRPMGGRAKEEMIRDHYRKKELAKYGAGKPSSADVWESRERKVEVGSEFSERYDPPIMSDEEWWAMEIRNRKAVQESLAKERSS